MPDLKDHGLNVSISSILSIGALGSMLWFIVQPLMISQISTAMADEMEEQIEEKTKPISKAFSVLLLSDINRLKRNIATMEYREEHEPETWTEKDATRLADYKIELEAFKEAIDDL
jgi:hypothetical protein